MVLSGTGWNEKCLKIGNPAINTYSEGYRIGKVGTKDAPFAKVRVVSSNLIARSNFCTKLVGTTVPQTPVSNPFINR